MKIVTSLSTLVLLCSYTAVICAQSPPPYAQMSQAPAIETPRERETPPRMPMSEIKEENLSDGFSEPAFWQAPLPSDAESFPAGSLSDELSDALERESGLGTVSQEIDDIVAEQQASDSGSLIAKITPATPPSRAASLRLTEEGRQLVNSGEHQKALVRLEKTIAIDSTNPYSYYYLGLVHYHLANFEESINFLDVAESLLRQEPVWLAQINALKRKNLQAMGRPVPSDVSVASPLTVKTSVPRPSAGVRQKLIENAIDRIRNRVKLESGKKDDRDPTRPETSDPTP